MKRVTGDAGHSSFLVSRQVARYGHRGNDIDGMRNGFGHSPSRGMATRADLCCAFVQQSLRPVKRQPRMTVKTSHLSDLIMDRIGMAESDTAQDKNVEKYSHWSPQKAILTPAYL